ncbi:PA14 domain-containing protein [Blastococcus sp. CT_GayMR16]|uniref:PA14 domain-containing protein n=1 Tax=Blastococcus sp. CT_GayMR16 TaxID=2559607 RepID=UPI0010736F4D|nr:PA14 domain-containing protein [Blastococcus sp. CT_GayMR16]TFV86862.1 sugar dehydrogenase [Blastococcus sp. CT_GayMR16]
MTQARRSLVASAVLVLVLSTAAVISAAAPAAAALPAGFTEVTAFSGLVNPTAIRFAPDGRVFVAEKRGTIQMYDSVADTTATQVADLRTEVHNFWDRGLLGLAIDPGFPQQPYLYALYTFDGPIVPVPGGRVPTWGTADTDSDPCPDPPGATSDGCVVSSKLVRLTLTGTTTVKTDLVHDWCQQYPSHSTGDLVFGRDGALYASAGDGASFEFTDYGQDGAPVNPCGDPGAVNGVMSPPSAEGGSLRAQDLRTAGDPVSLDGTVIRVDPATGNAAPGNPNAGAADPNAARIVAHGMRNPFRMVLRPGTDEVWVGDVGFVTWEEINRLPLPGQPVSNFGWPCLEGNGRTSTFDSADLKICEDLYAQGGDAKPYFVYPHGQKLSPSDTCATAGGASISGLSFQFYAGGPYPAAYDGALFFSDYARNCIWVVPKGANGLPDPAQVTSFVSGAAGPVDLELSPAGEVFYADFNGGTVRRIVYTGTGPVSCPAGQYRAEYFPNTTLAGTPAVTACESTLDHQWGAGGPPGLGADNFSARWTGAFDFPTAGTYTFTAVSDDGIRVWVDDVLLIDQWRAQAATTFTASRALTAGSHTVRVQYYEAAGSAVARLSWTAGGSPPQPQITAPATGTTWQVGTPIAFSGSATDPEDGALPAGALTWEMVLQHCPAACHAHSLQTWTGVSGASITAPDHEYPAYLDLRLTARDSSGRTTTVTRRLDPRTVPVTVASEPSGLSLAFGSRTATTPFTTTVIAGSTATLAAPSPQTLSGATYAFSRWSDGGAASHNVTQASTARTYTATFAGATGCPAGQYRAEYFPNSTLAGTAVRTACEAAPLDRTWGNSGPTGLPVDFFSARWTGSFTFPAGSRTFTAATDDGVRVWVDGVLIIDRWSTPGTTRATRTMTAGTHTVRVDYVERISWASARLTW